MIREFTAEEAEASDKFFVFMKQFEDTTGVVKVNVQHSRTVYTKLLKLGTAKIFVYEEDGVLYGAIGFLISHDLHSGEKIAVETFWFVSPEHRGIGKQLFNKFEETAKELGCEKLAMIHLVDSYPDTLKKFYEKSGYNLLEMHYVKEI